MAPVPLPVDEKMLKAFHEHMLKTHPKEAQNLVTAEYEVLRLERRMGWDPRDDREQSRDRGRALLAPDHFATAALSAPPDEWVDINALAGIKDALETFPPNIPTGHYKALTKAYETRAKARQEYAGKAHEAFESFARTAQYEEYYDAAIKEELKKREDMYPRETPEMRIGFARADVDMGLNRMIGNPSFGPPDEARRQFEHENAQILDQLRRENRPAFAELNGQIKQALESGKGVLHYQEREDIEKASRTLARKLEEDMKSGKNLPKKIEGAEAQFFLKCIQKDFAHENPAGIEVPLGDKSFLDIEKGQSPENGMGRLPADENMRRALRKAAQTPAEFTSDFQPQIMATPLKPQQERG